MKNAKLSKARTAYWNRIREIQGSHGCDSSHAMRLYNREKAGEYIGGGTASAAHAANGKAPDKPPVTNINLSADDMALAVAHATALLRMCNGNSSAAISLVTGCAIGAHSSLSLEAK